MSTNEVAKMLREYKELQAFIKQLEEEADAAKTAIIAEMEARQTDTLQADIFTVRYIAYASTRIDTTALKHDLPDVANRYARTTEARRFTIA